MAMNNNSAIQQINLGSRPKGEGGDNSREAGEKINANFEDLDERVALAQSTADSKTTNASDAHLLNRSNHTGTQSISTILGLQAALDSAASQVNITGNAATASKLASAVNINGVPFDGSQSISIGGTGEGRSGAIYSVMTNTEAQQGTSTSEKVITPAVLKSAIQYHAPEQTDISGNAATATSALYANEATHAVSSDTADSANHAATAGKLASPVQINGVDFDGTQNILLPSSGEYSLPTASASVLGGIKVGSGLDISNSVLSVGTLNQSTTGNAATATKLATAININGVPFDGSQDITIGADSNAARKIIAACTYTPASNTTNNLKLYTLQIKSLSQISESWAMTTSLTKIPFKVGDVVNVQFGYYIKNSGSVRTYNGDAIITGISGSSISFSTPGVSGYQYNANVNVDIGAIISDSNNILSITSNINSYSITLESNQNGNNLSLIVNATPIGSTAILHSNQTTATDLSASFELFYYSIVSSALAATKNVNAQFSIMVIA